jgi:hypothetical protein
VESSYVNVMSKSKELQGVPVSVGETGYGKQAYEYILREKMNTLRARLLNLADSITDNVERRKAMKGLIRDFCNNAYYPILREIESYLRYFKVLDEGSGQDDCRGLEDVELSIE